MLFVVMTTMAADDVSLTASAPSTVIMGRPFQITYTANAKVTDFTAPAITNFDILAGPFKSESHSTQIINGNVSSTVSVVYTYTIQAQSEGTFTIPSATIKVKGQKVSSSGLSIKVLPADEQADQSASTSSQQPSASASSSSSSKISSENLFIRPILSKSTVYEQEAVKLTYKLYTTYDVVQFSNKSMPDFKGFLKQEFERTGNTQLAYENYQGRNFLTAVLYEVILYPQTPGEIVIDKAEFEAIIRVQTRKQVRSIFDDFFDSYSNVAHPVYVRPTKVTVKDLPTNKPASFYGVVGQFSMNSSLSSQEVKANEAITLKVNINGNGNMKLLKNPDFKFPDAFEVYDPKVNNNFKTSAEGLSGNKAIEIIFIPRHSGNFEIPSTALTYFDLKERAYKTLRTPNYKIQVLKSDGTVDDTPVVSSYSNKEDLKHLGTDIRYINTSKFNLKQKETYYFISLKYWMLFIIPLLLASLLYFAFRKHIKDHADMDLVKNRKANKVARKRLKLAQKLLQQGDKEKFYEEVMKAVWTYLSDKLTIPMAAINKDNISAELLNKQVEQGLIDRLKDVLHTCEFARFAPKSDQQEMGNLYEETIDIISTLEDTIKR